jgi:DNA-binding LytR/AlgR family response regulator
LSQLRTEAHVVITTADAQHAVEAYRANAVDYLLKPIDPEQLKEAVTRIASAIANERIVRLLCRDREATKIVHLDDVLILRADGGYTNVQTEDAYYLLPDALTSIAERLPEHFVRVHRTAIVNIRHVSALDKAGESALLGRRGLDVPVSRRHLREFRRRLMYEK